MNKQEFKDGIDINVIEKGKYGHYPFYMHVLTDDDKLEINALALAGDVLAVYHKVQQYRMGAFKEIFLSIDFPASGDMPDDFVACFFLVGDDLELVLIPYNNETGERYEEVTGGKTIDDLKKQFQRASRPSLRIVVEDEGRVISVGSVYEKP